jgi:hypothetical protein
MDAFKLTKILKLHETEGWSIVPFIQGNNNSFYTDIIENSCITIAWVSIQNKISKKDLQLHHFRRQTNCETGIKNSLPRLLIVTDGKKWFLSKPGSDKFTQAKYSKILVSVYNEIKAIIIDLEITVTNILLNKKLAVSLELLKTQILVYGVSIEQNIPKPLFDLFSSNGQFRLEMPSNNDEQLNRYSKILHQQLFRRIHPKQIQFLLQYPKHDIFVNPFFIYNQFLVCVSKTPINRPKDDIKQALTFLIVDQFADAKEFHPTATFIEQEILPTLLKIDRELVKKYLTKEPF